MNTNKYYISIIVIGIVILCYGFSKDIQNHEVMSLMDFLKVAISFISSLLGIAFVLYEVEERSSMFIISIISSLLRLIYLYFWSPLIWDFVHTLGYLFISIYALYYWSRGRRKEKNGILAIQQLSLQGYGIISCSGVIGTAILANIGTEVSTYSSVLQSVADALTTVLSLIGQILLSRKYIETWYMWIIVNGVSIPLYISIASYTYASLFLCYLCLAFFGLYRWRKRLSLQE